MTHTYGSKMIRQTEATLTGGGRIQSWLGSQAFWNVLVANHGGRAKFNYDSEDMGGDVGTVRIVADVFREQIFATVRGNETGLDRYLRNSASCFSLRGKFADRNTRLGRILRRAEQLVKSRNAI